jgi:hypothetical protein
MALGSPAGVVLGRHTPGTLFGHLVLLLGMAVAVSVTLVTVLGSRLMLGSARIFRPTWEAMVRYRESTSIGYFHSSTWCG